MRPTTPADDVQSRLRHGLQPPRAARFTGWHDTRGSRIGRREQSARRLIGFLLVNQVNLHLT